MTQLTVVNHNGIEVVDSREVAEMMEREHRELLKTIRQNIEYLSGGEVPPTDFFIESTYFDSQNKERPNFLITKKGCDFIANKMIGQKGALFTAAYVNAFEKMREHIAKSMPPMSTNEIVLMMAQNAVKMEQDIKELQVQTATLTEQTTALTEKFDGAVRAFYRPNTIGEWKVDTEMAIRELSKSINFRGRIYCELETRSGCNLNVRLTRARNRLVKNGMTKAQANKINKLDIIGMDKNLRNIFDAIVREHQAAAVVGVVQPEVIDAEFEEVG